MEKAKGTRGQLSGGRIVTPPGNTQTLPDLNITQAKIAGLLGVSRECVSGWFNRKKRNNGASTNVSQIDCRVKIDPKAKPLILERVESGETAEARRGGAGGCTGNSQCLVWK